MKIRFVSRGRLRAFTEGYESEGEELILFGFDGMDEVSYEKELKGESDEFERAALLSKAAKTTVVCGCITDTRGLKRKSAVVAEGGRLVGVSDAMHAIDGETNAGAALRIYDVKAGRMGLLVADDLLFPEAIRSLSLCGSDFIVCIFGGVRDTLTQSIVRTYAYLYGVPVLFCGVGSAMIADVGGSITFSSREASSIAEMQNAREYHLVETRRRGLKA